MLMAWVGHVFASAYGGSGAGTQTMDHDHVHAGEVDAVQSVQSSLLPHGHGPVTADHVHETPYLMALMRLPGVAPASLRLEIEQHFLPSAVLTPPDRPPRSFPSF